MRRAMIAAYEAESNVVIHACRGVMNATLLPARLDVEVNDEGPGIADIELAMKEGYSTASPRARQLGFGAGLGLPNIRKNSDRFAIESEVGRGTRVRFSVDLPAARPGASAANSVQVHAERCTRCLRCVRACPGRAMRVWEEGPEVLEHLCLDCGACLAACPAEALSIAADGPKVGRPARLVAPAAFLAQFGADAPPARVAAALARLGLEPAQVVEDWLAPVRRASAQWADESAALPVIVPACPAALGLVQVRFPSLLAQVAPFLTPYEAAARENAGAVFGAPCPAAATVAALAGGVETVDLADLRRWLAAEVAAVAAAEVEPPAGAGRASDGLGIMRVSGARHAADVLEAVEDGRLGDVTLVEIWLCDQGCFGGPRMREDAFVARARWQRACWPAGHAAAMRRDEPLAARAGLRLDPDMRAAMAKLSRIDQMRRRLPGRDCGLCGAPDCAAFAEDVVLGRVGPSACAAAEPGQEKQA
jgi:Na+-translocating ferredoxin:NAD+ oxidoreductase RNF subunit RnfB/anti-sigma regulatory factor (Ser/Thr protein kinase)